MVEMKIVLDDNGQCRVEGPIDQKIICYGLLELAKEAIHLHHVNNDRRIVPASIMPVIPKTSGN